jgi:hypothetical protein
MSYNCDYDTGPCMWLGIDERVPPFTDISADGCHV